MLIDFVIIGIFFLLAIPTVTGYFAYSYGLSFWLWFILGCCLPLFANILLIFMVKNYEKTRKNDMKLTYYEDKYMHNLIRETLTGTDSLSKTKKEP